MQFRLLIAGGLVAALPLAYGVFGPDDAGFHRHHDGHTQVADESWPPT